jgi:hypothetical protein
MTRPKTTGDNTAMEILVGDQPSMASSERESSFMMSIDPLFKQSETQFAYP